MALLGRYPAFRWLWFGQLLSQFGNAIFMIMGLWEIELRSPFLLSIAGLAMMLPTLLMVVGGTIVDRHDPVRLMLGTDLVRGVAVGLGLLTLLLPGSLAWAVIGLLLVNSLGGTLFGPAEAVLLPRLVTDADLPGANGIYSITSLLSGAIGSAIGGAAIVAIGVRPIFGFDMASFWLSALALWLVLRTLGPSFRRVMADRLREAPEAGDFAVRSTAVEPSPPSAKESPDPSTVPKTLRSPSLLAQIREGLYGLKALSWLLRLVPLILVTNLAYNAGFTMLPYWSRHHLHATAFGFGMIDASWALGMVIGGLAVGRLSRWPLLRVLAVIGSAQGLMTLGFAFSHSVSLSATLLGLGGIANGMTNALIFTMLQRVIPERVRGRALGAFVSLLTVASPLGALVSGLALHVLPLSWSWDLGGVSILVLALIMWGMRIDEANSQPDRMSETLTG